MENSQYIDEQVQAIEAWKNEEPGVVSKAFGIVIEPLAWLVRKVVPEAAVRGVLDMSNAAARWMSDSSDICRDAEVKSINELKNKDLELSDKLANEVHNWAIGVGVGEGAATGAFGILGAPADVPAIITLALRTIHKIGKCYGYECDNDVESKFVYGVLAASGANSIEEKVAALAALKVVQQTLSKMTWKKMTEKAAEAAIKNQLGKEGAIIGIKNLAKQLGINITKRRALAAIPFIGAAIGGSVNGWYIKEVGWAARHSFQERWLRENELFEEEIHID
jgi:uncharacterized protein (DUF697 family)